MLKGENKERYEGLKAELKEHDDLYVPDPPVGTGIREMGNDPPPHARPEGRRHGS